MTGVTMPLVVACAVVATRLSPVGVPRLAMPLAGAITRLPELPPPVVRVIALTVNVRLVLPPLFSTRAPPAFSRKFRVAARPTATFAPEPDGEMLIVPPLISRPAVPRGVPDVAVASSVAPGVLTWAPPVRPLAPANELAPLVSTNVAPPMLKTFSPPPPPIRPLRVTVPEPYPPSDTSAAELVLVRVRLLLTVTAPEPFWLMNEPVVWKDSAPPASVTGALDELLSTSPRSVNGSAMSLVAV